MAELTTLARPYARAAFEVALQDSALDEWSRMLSLSAEIAGQDEVSVVLASPSLSTEQISESFIKVCGDELNVKAKNFVQVLAENKRLVLLPEISILFEGLKDLQILFYNCVFLDYNYNKLTFHKTYNGVSF